MLWTPVGCQRASEGDIGTDACAASLEGTACKAERAVLPLSGSEAAKEHADRRATHAVEQPDAVGELKRQAEVVAREENDLPPLPGLENAGAP